jgi:glycosyltransferase involved in cell wall biosynthesis
MASPSVLHIDTGKEFRGGQRQVYLLNRRLHRQGIKQVVACPEGSELSKRIKNIPIALLPKRSLIRKIFLRPLKKAIEDHNVNIVHAHDSEAHTLALLLKKSIPRLKLIVTRRVVFAPSGRLSVRYKYRRHAGYYIAISKAVAESLRAAGIDDDCIEIIHSGLDLESIRAAVKGNSAVSKITNRYEYIIVTAGALTPEKDFATAIRAFELVSKQIPDAAMLILGDGTGREELEKMIAERNLDNVYLPGFKEPLAPILKAAHVFLLTSTSEGLSSSAIEAAACGLPLVVSNVGGLPEVAEYNFNGILCRPRDAKSYADAVIDLLADGKKRERMSANSIEKSQRFDIETNAKKTAELYNRLLVD